MGRVERFGVLRLIGPYKKAPLDSGAFCINYDLYRVRVVIKPKGDRTMARTSLLGAHSSVAATKSQQ